MARILVAEDDEPVRSFVRRALESDGHVVEEARDGAEALEKLEAAKGGFDLLLADIRMPVMDGVALALAAAPQFPVLPILLMTGYADQRERARGLDAIVDDILAKPFSLADIRAKVTEILATGARRGG